MINYSIYRDLFSSSSSSLAAGNSSEEASSSIQETVCHPDHTTMQQHNIILDGEVTLCSENGKKSRKQRISECFTVMMVHVQALLTCFPA